MGRRSRPDSRRFHKVRPMVEGVRQTRREDIAATYGPDGSGGVCPHIFVPYDPILQPCDGGPCRASLGDHTLNLLPKQTRCSVSFGWKLISKSADFRTVRDNDDSRDAERTKIGTFGVARTLRVEDQSVGVDFHSELIGFDESKNEGGIIFSLQAPRVT